MVSKNTNTMRELIDRSDMVSKNTNTMRELIDRLSYIDGYRVGDPHTKQNKTLVENEREQFKKSLSGYYDKIDREVDELVELVFDAAEELSDEVDVSKDPKRFATDILDTHLTEDWETINRITDIIKKMAIEKFLKKQGQQNQ